MLTFKDYIYERPAFEIVKTEAESLVEEMKEASSVSEAKQIIDKMNSLQRGIDTQTTLASIRHSIDTTDNFYDQEDRYWNEYLPLYQEVFNQFSKEVVYSPYRNQLEEDIPSTYFMILENGLKVFDSSVIELLQKENQLSSDYNKLIASAQIEFDGKTLNLSQFGPYLQHTERKVRKEASNAQWVFFEKNEEKLDELYDQLVKVRTKMAKKLGFKDFVEMAYVRMNRFDYNREMVDVYRQQVLDYVVPVTQKLHDRQAKRIGITDMKHYDTPLKYLDGNPTPQGDPAYIIENGRKMYHELSDETAEFIDFLFDRELVDLLAKEGKESGGYCTFISEHEAPFIFANFNGTSADIDVLTHEAGHAFQFYQSRWIKNPELTFPTYETCEIHSMSMEFFTYPWMELFFKEQTDKYKFDHLSSALEFLPYGVLVDHFQHEVYEYPEMTPAERKVVWRKLEKQYLPNRNFSENEFLDKGTFWFKQGHIFDTPFYYIDYTLAQVCALQFWKRAIIDEDPKAWQDYMNICHVGGTQSFLDVVSLAHLNSPFEKGSLSDVVKVIDEELAKVDDIAL